MDFFSYPNVSCWNKHPSFLVAQNMIEVYFLPTHSPDPWVVFLQAVTQEPRFLLSCGSSFLTPHVGVLGCLQSAWGRKWRPLRGALVYPGQNTGPFVSAHNPLPGSATWPHLTRRGWELPSNRGHCTAEQTGLVLS